LVIGGYFHRGEWSDRRINFASFLRDDVLYYDVNVFVKVSADDEIFVRGI
jgi:hypothetical protein